MGGFNGRGTRHLHCPRPCRPRRPRCRRSPPDLELFSDDTHLCRASGRGGCTGFVRKTCRSGDVHLPLGYPGRPCRGREEAQAEVHGGFSSDSGDARASGDSRACRRGRRRYGCSCERRFRNCREALTTNPPEELHPRRNADIQSVCNHGGTCRYSHGCNLTVYRHSWGAILRTVPGAPGKLSKNGTQCP